MEDSTTPPTAPASRRRRFYVHKFQRKYAIVLGLTMFMYSVILFGLALMAPYIAPALKLGPAVPVEERMVAANQFFALTQIMWPAVIGLILGAAFFSMYVTHRIAGPLHRLHVSAKELVDGNLSLRIKFRKGDELQDLAEVMNEAIKTIEDAMMEIRDREAVSRKAVRESIEIMYAQPGGHQQSASNQEVIGQLETALKEGEQIDALFSSFRLSK